MDNRRLFTRFPFSEPVGYQASESTSNGSLSKDLSAGGVRIVVNEFIPLHTELQVKLHLQNPLRLVDVKGHVVWVRELPMGEQFEVGIEFISQSNANQVISQYFSKSRLNAV